MLNVQSCQTAVGCFSTRVAEGCSFTLTPVKQETMNAAFLCFFRQQYEGFFFTCYILYISKCMFFCSSFSVFFSLVPLVVIEWNKGLSLWPLIFHCLLFQQYCCWEHALIASKLFFYDKQNTFLALQQLVCHQTCCRALREMLTSAV